MTTYNISSSIQFSSLSIKDIPTIVAAFSDLGWVKPAALYESYLEEQSKGERNIWVAWDEEIFLGYVTLKWTSAYEPFRAQKIPEIKDSNVLPKYRGQGIGTKLMGIAEEAARQKGPYAGLSVGLTADYGAAQKLYAKRGYIPDGHGITSHNASAQWGEWVQIDDDLVIWLVKILN